jgi:hypothetical protein
MTNWGKYVTMGTAMGAGAVGCGFMLVMLARGAWPTLPPSSMRGISTVADAQSGGALTARTEGTAGHLLKPGRSLGDPFTLTQDGTRKTLQIPRLPPPPVALPEPPLLPAPVPTMRSAGAP